MNTNKIINTLKPRDRGCNPASGYLSTSGKAESNGKRRDVLTISEISFSLNKY